MRPRPGSRTAAATRDDLDMTELWHHSALELADMIRDIFTFVSRDEVLAIMSGGEDMEAVELDLERLLATIK